MNTKFEFHGLMNRKVKGFPVYAVLISIILFAMQAVLYEGAQLVNAHFPLHDLTIQGFDTLVPLVPAFVVVYGAAYAMWILFPIAAGRTERGHFFDYAFSCMLGLVIGALIFMFFPTTITRPVVEDTNIFNRVLNFIYRMDSPERVINLFPSYHCMLNIYCWLAVAGRKELPKWYRILTFVMAVLIVISTQVLKQHYIVDFLGAAAICAVTFLLSKNFHWGKWLERLVCGRDRTVPKTEETGGFENSVPKN